MYKQESWSLDNITNGQSLQALEDELNQRASDFAKIKGTLDANMNTGRFNGMLSQSEKIIEIVSKISGHASLTYTENTQSEVAAARVTSINQLESEISNKMLFLRTWWEKTLDDANAARLASDTGDREEYLMHQRRLARHTLSEKEEKVINTLQVTGSAALIKIYDTITNAYTYSIKIDGTANTMNREALTKYVRSENGQYREDAYVALLSRYFQERNVLGEIYHNVVLNYNNEKITLRGYDTPISAANAANNIDDKTTTALLEVCRKEIPIFRRFFGQKAAILGLGRLRRYDLYAPSGSSKRKYEYDDAVRLVLKVITNFSDILGGYARTVFDQKHVHSTIQNGKMSGAFCSTISPSITPFVLLNYTGESQDVFTMAHELGHAIHSMAASARSILVQHAPTPLAETASTFSEMLLYDHLSQEMSASEETAILASKLDDLYASIQRQAFFTLFEMEAHQKLASGATPGEISKAYDNTLKEQFAGVVDLSEDFMSEWLAIPHFYHSPFYCYSYSFGNLLAASLFQRYKKEGNGFADIYIKILAAGGSRKPEHLLAEYGFDITSTNFWRDGFRYISSLTDRLDDIKGSAA